MENLSEFIKKDLLDQGASLVGIGDLSEIPADVRQNMSCGISVAVAIDREVVKGMSDRPTLEYYYAKKYINKEITLCGKCIQVCPYTQRYLSSVTDKAEGAL